MLIALRLEIRCRLVAGTANHIFRYGTIPSVRSRRAIASPVTVPQQFQDVDLGLGYRKSAKAESRGWALSIPATYVLYGNR